MFSIHLLFLSLLPYPADPPYNILCYAKFYIHVLYPYRDVYITSYLLSLVYIINLLFLLFPASELQSIKALFNEKEKELSVAVVKVESLTRQLEDLRRGSATEGNKPSPAHNELDKLKQELMVRVLLTTAYILLIFIGVCILKLNTHVSCIGIVISLMCGRHV